MKRFSQFLNESAPNQQHPDLPAIARILQHLGWTWDSVSPALNAPPHALYCEYPVGAEPYQYSRASYAEVDHIETYHFVSEHTGFGEEHSFSNELTGPGSTGEFMFNLIWHPSGWWSKTDAILARNGFMSECQKVFGERYVKVDTLHMALTLKPGDPVNADLHYGPYVYKKFKVPTKPLDLGGYKDPFEQEGTGQ